jgi:ribA/ribD-fused uncharacterized protein
MRMITEFRGEYHFLSNFHPATTMYDGVYYVTSEHAFAAAKTLNLTVREHISEIAMPGNAKKFGRTLKLRPDWETVKIGIMKTIVRDKFIRNPDLREKLLATEDAILVEGNTWGDDFWGMIKNADGEYVGDNYLGKILMQVRGELGAQ